MAIQRVVLMPEAVTFSTLPLLVLDIILSYLDRSSLLTMRRLNAKLKEISRYRLTLEMQLDVAQTMDLHQDPIDMLFLKPIQFLRYLTVPIRQSFVAMKMLRQANLSECEIERVLKFNPDAFNAFPLVFQMPPLSGAIMDKNKLTFFTSKVSGTLSLKTRNHGAVKSFQNSSTLHAVLYESGLCEIYYNALNNGKTPKLQDWLSDCKELYSCECGFLIESKRSQVFYVFKDGYAQMKPLELPENQSVVKVFPFKEAIYVQLSNHHLIGVGMLFFTKIPCANTVQSIFNSDQHHFLAVLDNHSYIVWGQGYTHPQTKNLPNGRTIESVFWTSKITIALLDDGTPLIWKRNPSDSIDPFPSIPKECTVKNIYCCKNSFIAELDNKKLYTWGLSEFNQDRFTDCSNKGIQSIYNNEHGYVLLLTNGMMEFMSDPSSDTLFQAPVVPNDRFVKAVYSIRHSFLLLLDNHDLLAIVTADHYQLTVLKLSKGEPIARIITHEKQSVLTILYKNNKLRQTYLPLPSASNRQDIKVYQKCVKLGGKKLLSLEDLMENRLT